MIQQNNARSVRAVGLLSGGLDSTLAAKIVSDLGVEVHGVYFAMPWGCCDKVAAQEAAEKIGIKFIVLQLDERYLEMVKKPEHGYGKVMNPCVDCRIHMFSRAAQFAHLIAADFVFTGEVLGQRPMSQRRHSMRWIEEGTGLQGRLLRPLCAQLMAPTIPEKEGLIDRSRLLKITGRSRKEQMKLADGLGITDYPNPAGGCLLTDKSFARRMKDTLQYGYRSFRETIALKWGRHFRIDETYKIILGRDESENHSLTRYAHSDDYILELPQLDGPTLILKGENPSDQIFALAAGLIQRYSKYKDAESITVNLKKVNDKNFVRQVKARILSEDVIEGMRV